jgi:hypothetical protein
MGEGQKHNISEFLFANCSGLFGIGQPEEFINLCSIRWMAGGDSSVPGQVKMNQQDTSV